jgi:hypothetical protein
VPIGEALSSAARAVASTQPYYDSNQKNGAPPPGPRRQLNTDISVRACGPVRSAAHVGSVCSPRSQPVHYPATRTG